MAYVCPRRDLLLLRTDFSLRRVSSDANTIVAPSRAPLMNDQEVDKVTGSHCLCAHGPSHRELDRLFSMVSVTLARRTIATDNLTRQLHVFVLYEIFR